MADVAYGSLPFAEQIAFFRRKLNLETNAWTDIWQAAHDHAFVVAGANRADLVADFRAAIDKAIANGATLQDFRRDFDTIVAKHGWSYNGGRNWRSRVIYETNLRTSYAAGRYAQLQAAKRRMPYWQYVHSDAVSHPRPLHLSWNGLILPADDPWWQTHFCPNGWGCQCTIHALSARDLARLRPNGQPDDAPNDGTETVTVGQRGPTPRTVETPVGVDPGFGYTPGASTTTPSALGTLRSPPGLPSFRGPVARGLDAAFDAADLRYVDLPMAQARALHETERTIATADVEHAVGINAAGEIAVSASGTRTRVNLAPYRSALRGLTVTHNHPSGTGFSFEDIAAAAWFDLGEMRVITSSGLYRLSVEPGAQWPGQLALLVVETTPLRQELTALVRAYVRRVHARWPQLDGARLNRLANDHLVLLLQRRFPMIRYRVITP